MGRIGRSLVEGQGFSNPFDGNTGSTAWEPPLYPLLIAGVFKLFGVYSRASAFVLLAINSAFSALTCIPIFLVAKRVFGDKTAIWSAWLWVLLPNFIFWCTRWIWETSLAALLLTVIVWLALTLEEKGGWKPWAEFGLLWGVAALVNTSLLAFLPASGLWIWYRRSRLGKRSVAGIALSAIVFFVCIAPWLIRNYRVFGQFIFIRSNFGAELRLGNGPGADGRWMDFEHPSKDPEQLRLYARMGELSYVAMRKQEALQFIREDYGRFARISLRRVFYFWAGEPQTAKDFRKAPLKRPFTLVCSLLTFVGLGMALRRRNPGAWLFFWLFANFPLIYYLVFTHPRYRHPIEPEMLIAIVALAVSYRH
jgi:4-amino-4-deoxy-L-arabinose transferase-like glycosyltransferase